jgi:peptidoglycan/LPS O-acetylase OafA/YrhL
VLLLWALSYLVSLGGTFRVSFILCTALVLPTLLLKNSFASQLLGSRACIWIGKRTYSMYLFHAFCLTAVEEKWSHQGTAIAFLTTVALVYLLSLGVASVVYFMLEKPAVSWGRELAHAFRGKQAQPAGKHESRTCVVAQRSPAA